jgi:LPS-assembly protein
MIFFADSSSCRPRRILSFRMVRTLLLALLASAALVATARPAYAQAQPPSHGCDVKWDAHSQVADNVNETHTRLIQNVQVDCNDIQLFGDEVEIFSDIDRLRASGNVVFVSGTSRIAAERMEFNTRTKTGTFYVASGTVNMENRGIDASFFGGGEPAAYFWGETVEKLGPDRYRISKGGFTTCVQPTPRWELVSGTTTLTVDKRAILKNTVLKVKDVPLFYLPIMYYPINRENRSTGFLMPTYGSSTVRGRTLNNAFFWAISRSQDATVYHDWFSKTGQSLGGEYRYTRTQGSGELKSYFLNEHKTTYEQSDGTLVPYDGARNYQVTGTASEKINSHLRATFNANYFSSLVVQQRYQQDIYNATNRSRIIGANLQGNWGAQTVSVTADRSETLNNDVSSYVYGSKPRVLLGRGEKKIHALPLYYGAKFEYVQLIRQEILGERVNDRSLTRLDFVPTIRFPFTHWSFLTFNTSAAWHDTYWTESLVNNLQVEEPVSRKYYDLSTRVSGPTFSRVWTKSGSGGTQKFKHVIEPNFSVRRTSAFENYDKIVKLDGSDYNVGGFTRLNYGVASRLYAKKEHAREIVTFSIDQSYYTDENASRYDSGYSSSYLYGEPSNFSPVTYQLRVSPTALIDGSMVAEYDTKKNVLQLFNVNGSASVLPFVRASGGWSHRKNDQYAPDNPNRTDNFLQASATLSSGLPAALKGFYQFNYDLKRKVFVQQRISAAYNSQCCGIAVEYQSFNYATGGLTFGVPKDRRFNISFTLAGIGSFSNLFGSYGGQQGR